MVPSGLEAPATEDTMVVLVLSLSLSLFLSLSFSLSFSAPAKAEEHFRTERVIRQHSLNSCVGLLFFVPHPCRTQYFLRSDATTGRGYRRTCADGANSVTCR